jgi:hypothetical protein
MSTAPPTTPIQAQNNSLNSTVARTPVTTTTEAPLTTTTASSAVTTTTTASGRRSVAYQIDRTLKERLVNFEHRIANLVLI